MTLAEISQEFKEALTVHSVFEAFGIPMSEIFVSYKGGILSVIARQGEKQFAVDVAKMEMTAEEFPDAWKEVVEVYNAAAQADRVTALDKTVARQQAVEILAALASHGFERCEKKTAEAAEPAEKN